MSSKRLGTGLLVRHRDGTVLKAWQRGCIRNEALGLAMPTPAGVSRMWVCLYENQQHFQIATGLVAVVDAGGEHGRPEMILFNGDELVAMSVAVDAATAGWLAACWMSAWIDDERELRATVSRMIAERVAANSGMDGTTGPSVGRLH